MTDHDTDLASVTKEGEASVSQGVHYARAVAEGRQEPEGEDATAIRDLVASLRKERDEAKRRAEHSMWRIDTFIDAIGNEGEVDEAVEHVAARIKSERDALRSALAAAEAERDEWKRQLAAAWTAPSSGSPDPHSHPAERVLCIRCNAGPGVPCTGDGSEGYPDVEIEGRIVHEERLSAVRAVAAQDRSAGGDGG